MNLGQPDENISVVDYQYDPLNRLIEAKYSDSRLYQYTYDSVGNRLTQTAIPSQHFLPIISNSDSGGESLLVEDQSTNTLIDIYSGYPAPMDFNTELLMDGNGGYPAPAASDSESILDQIVDFINGIFNADDIPVETIPLSTLNTGSSSSVMDSSGTNPFLTNYTYDDANRMTSVNGVTITWDNNGNLRNDGINNYTYNGANRLIAYSNGIDSSSYTYNGLGDRLSQTVNGVTTEYTLDLNTGLSQVLTDGENTYLYGLSRLGQEATTTEFFLGDALGSVRQLTNGYGEVTLSKSYDPFGNNLLSLGTGETVFGFTGETTDANGLINLRARYFNPEQGRFITRDTWEGDVNTPPSLNRFTYAHDNPVMNTDPSGYCIFAIVDTMICSVVTGSFFGTVFGATIGASYGAFMYNLALSGRCGCEGEQLISQYSQSQFIFTSMGYGAIFGALFGALSGAGLGWAAVGALATLGISSVSLGFAVQRLVSDPSNACAWLDLGLSVIAIASSVSYLTLLSDTAANVFYNLAIKNPEAGAAVIGPYAEGSSTSYEQIGTAKGLTHLNLPEPFASIFNAIRGKSEWWPLINERYIRSIASQGKPVYLTDNPNKSSAISGFKKEFNLLLELGYGDLGYDNTLGLWFITKH